MSHDDAIDLSRFRRDSARFQGTYEKLDRARERLIGWREGLEAAGFRTNLSLIPPCSIAARRGDDSDERWVTVLPTGLVALELREVGADATTWSRATENEREPTLDDVLRTVRALFARGVRGRVPASGSPLSTGAAPRL